MTILHMAQFRPIFTFFALDPKIGSLSVSHQVLMTCPLIQNNAVGINHKASIITSILFSAERTRAEKRTKSENSQPTAGALKWIGEERGLQKNAGGSGETH